MSFIERLGKKISNYSSNVITGVSPLKEERLWVSTGAPELDFNLKTFGFKCGLVEIAGESGAGKTTLGLNIIKNFLKQDKNAICIMMFSEERLNEDYVKRMEVPLDRVLKVKEKMLEDLFYKTQLNINKIEEAWNEEKLPGKPKIILLWDSIGATSSRSELETYKENVSKFKAHLDKGNKFETKHAKMASFAKTARDLVKAMLSQLYDKDIIFIALNHLTANMDAMAKKKDTSTGGTWREYFSWLRLEMKLDKLKTGKLKIDGERWGQVSTIKVIKNDFAGYVQTDLKLCIGHSVMLNDNDIEYAIEKGILNYKDGKYSFMDGKLVWSTPRSIFQLYRKNDPLLKIFHKKVEQQRHNDVLNRVDVKVAKGKKNNDEELEEEYDEEE